MDWEGRHEDKEEISCSGRSMRGYIKSVNVLFYVCSQRGGIKQTWLYSDLLQALRREHMSALGSQQRGPYNMKQNEAQSTCAESTNDGVN